MAARKKATKAKKPAEPEACLVCKFFRPPENRLGVGVCQRFPHEEWKRGESWCGEFKRL